MQILKANDATSHYRPLEAATVTTDAADAARLVVRDGAGRVYCEHPIRPHKPERFKVRGESGKHRVTVEDSAGNVLDEQRVTLTPRTDITCDRGPYAKLMMLIQQMIETDREIAKPWVIHGRTHRFFIWWSRDHVYTLKAAKYFVADVLSGLDYFLDRQLPSGMFWDNIQPNPCAPAPTWLHDAMGKGWFTYEDQRNYGIRRIPILADTEYVFTEGVWSAWKASGDDAWMARQLPRLEKGLRYMTTNPVRWSTKHGLMRRSFTMDEWDFANPHYCAGDARCIYPEDARFLFHGNQSGLYATYWRMAEMYEHMGNAKRAAELRKEGEAFRRRANAKLFFKNHYGHMIPETLDEKKVYALVGDERERMSLSTGYTINRKMPTHDMVVKILKEYQRRGKAHKAESFAEWWSMDPMYSPAQWPVANVHSSGEGDYMNGGVSPLVAGELAKGAFDHGMEAYGADILERLWKLSERDGGYLHDTYKRLPEDPTLPKARFQFVDLRSLANRGLRHGAHKGVEAWLGEGDNDMRHLPTGRRKFGAIEFDVIKPAANAGRAVVRLDADPAKAPTTVTVPLAGVTARSLYFLHTLGRPGNGKAPAATYEVTYADGAAERIWVRGGQEIALWWGSSEQEVNRATTRRAWWGANGLWDNMVMFMFGWNNPHPDKPITSIRIEMVKDGDASLLLAAISLSDRPVAFEQPIRSAGLPPCWPQAAVYYAVAEGLAGIEDAGAAFSVVRVSPRWSASQASRAAVTLHYPASNAYCSYDYRLDRKARTITFDLTGSFQRAEVHCLLPAGKAKRVEVDGREVSFKSVRIEKSNYADFALDALPRGPVTITY
jgi:hypothetical protein